MWVYMLVVHVYISMSEKKSHRCRGLHCLLLSQFSAHACLWYIDWYMQPFTLTINQCAKCKWTWSLCCCSDERKVSGWPSLTNRGRIPHVLSMKKSKNHISQWCYRLGVTCSHSMRRMHCGQYQASSATLEWLGRWQLSLHRVVVVRWLAFALNSARSSFGISPVFSMS